MTQLTGPVAFPETTAAFLPFAAGLVVAIALVWAVRIGVARSDVPPTVA
ncbi:hypothetical protein [Streptomyces sp. NPDC087300]